MCGCGNKKTSSKRVSKSTITTLPDPAGGVAWVWYEGNDYKRDIANVPTNAKYRPQGGDGCAFRVFQKDVPYLSSLLADNGTRLFLTSDEFNGKSEPVDYSAMKVKELKQILAEKGLSTDGKKSELVQRLLDDK